MQRPTQRERVPRALHLAAWAYVAAVCFWQLGSTPLLETDEGFAANRAASFARHHTWRLSYEDIDTTTPQFRKPPLLYWAVATLYPVLGHNTWSVRLPVAGAALGACVLLYRLNRRHFDDWTALGAVMLLVSIPFVRVHIRTAMLELPLLALVLLATYALAYPHHNRGSALLAGAAAGAAILLKGSAGMLALIVAGLLTLLSGRGHRDAWRRVAMAVAVAALVYGAYAFLVVPPAWQGPMLASMWLDEGTHRVATRSLAKDSSALP